LVQSSPLDGLIPQKTRDSFARGDEHKDAEHFDYAQCTLAKASEEKKVVILKIKDNVFE
jgi:hypothetical protein